MDKIEMPDELEKQLESDRLLEFTVELVSGDAVLTNSLDDLLQKREIVTVSFIFRENKLHPSMDESLLEIIDRLEDYKILSIEIPSDDVNRWYFFRDISDDQLKAVNFLKRIIKKRINYEPKCNRLSSDGGFDSPAESKM